MKRFCALILMAATSYNCEPVSSEIGADFFTDGVLDLTYIDSATVNLSTIRLEDLVTSNATRMLVGSHRDTDLGIISATPFFQVSPESQVNFEDQNVVYDYLSLVLPLDHYSYYDTLSPLTLSVHRVTDEIETDNGYVYNHTTFPIEEESLGSVTFKPRPHGDSIEIKLSDVLGQEIFQKAITGSEELTSGNFLKYIRGFAVVADTSMSACILGVTTNPKLKLHYIDKSTTPAEEKSAEFQTSSHLFFTHISTNRKNTALEIMPSASGRLSSMLTNDRAYIQAGAGLALRIDLPYLHILKQLPNFYPTRAILEIYPTKKLVDVSSQLPSELHVFQADKRNSIYKSLETTALLVEDTDLGRDTHYTFDATAFVNEQMALQLANENALIFTTDNTTYPVSAERLYAAATSHEYKTRLRIYFATVNQ